MNKLFNLLTLCITMLYNIEELIWDDQNIEHIKKHSVTKIEIEEVCLKGVYYLVTARDTSRKERGLINEK